VISPVLVVLFILDIIIIGVALYKNYTPLIPYSVLALALLLIWAGIWHLLSSRWGIQKIMFSKTSFAVIFLAFFAAGVSMIFSTHLLVYTAVFIFTSLVIIFFWSLFSSAGLTVRREHLRVALVGQPMTITITLRNASRWPRFAVIGFDYFPAVSREAGYQEMCFVSIRGGSEVPLTYEAVPTLRGDWKVGPFYFWGGDPFGFFKHERLVEEYTELVVIPVPFRVKLSMLDSVSLRAKDEASTIPLAGESVEFLGVREYKEGDSMRKIHWMSSAKNPKLITKQFERNVASTMSFLLVNTPEMSAGDNPEKTPLEDALKIIISLAQAAVKLGYQVSFTHLGSGVERDTRAGTGQSFFYDLSLVLARIGKGEPVNLSAELPWIAASVPEGSTLMVFAPSVRPIEKEIYHQFGMRFRQVTVVHFDLESYSKGIQPGPLSRTSESFGFFAYKIAYGDDLKRVTDKILRLGRKEVSRAV